MYYNRFINIRLLTREFLLMSDYNVHSFCLVWGALIEVGSKIS